MSLSIIISIVGLLIAVAGFVATYFGFVLRLMDADAQTNKRTAELEGRVAEIEGKMVLCAEHSHILEQIPEIKSSLEKLNEQSRLYWEVISPKLRDIIHSPIHVVRDELVDKLIDDKIDNLDDALQLEQELEELTNDNQEDQTKRIIGAIFLAYIHSIVQDLQQKNVRGSYY